MSNTTASNEELACLVLLSRTFDVITDDERRYDYFLNALNILSRLSRSQMSEYCTLVGDKRRTMFFHHLSLSLNMAHK